MHKIFIKSISIFEYLFIYINNPNFYRCLTEKIPAIMHKGFIIFVYYFIVSNIVSYNLN